MTASARPASESSANLAISALLRAVTWLEVAILAWAGGGLLLHPPLVVALWPWTLSPFNTRYLGALYLAAFVAALLQALSGRWSPARVVTPMIFVFTLIVTVYSFVHLPRFNFARVEAWVWFVLYIGVCVNAGAHLWLYRHRPTPLARKPSGAWRVALLLQFGALAAYGAALLVAPATASIFWPWKLDPFHAHLYSVTFITPAVGALVLLRAAEPRDTRALGWTQAGWGLLPVVGLAIADASAQRVSWNAAGTWAWIALFGAMFVTGMWTAIEANRPDRIDSADAADPAGVARRRSRGR